MTAPKDYSRTQIALHWIIVALVLFQLVLHEGIQQALQARLNGTEVPMVNPHVVVGVLILLLVVWRLWLRLARGVPDLPQGELPLLKMTGSATHWLFYLLLFILPFSGMAVWFLGAEPARVAHNIARIVLMLLILLHFAAAMSQHFISRSNVLMRMLGRP